MRASYSSEQFRRGELISRNKLFSNVFCSGQNGSFSACGKRRSNRSIKSTTLIKVHDYHHLRQGNNKTDSDAYDEPSNDDNDQDDDEALLGEPAPRVKLKLQQEWL